MGGAQNKLTKFIDLGLMAYQEAWDYQAALFEATVALKAGNRKKGPSGQRATPNYLIFCSHPHVYTLGKSGNRANLLLDGKGLEKKNAAFYRTNRGGDITYHGPGQIVGYPVLDLDNFFTDIHKYLRCLEEAVILTLADYGVAAGRIEGLTGVWVGSGAGGRGAGKARKICALGVRSSRWVTMHGFALNVLTDLGYFQNIVPCGIGDKGVTSLGAEIGGTPDMAGVQSKLKGHLAGLFGFDFGEGQGDGAG